MIKLCIDSPDMSNAALAAKVESTITSGLSMVKTKFASPKYSEPSSASIFILGEFTWDNL